MPSPGWLARYKAIERTPSYVPLSQNYAKNIGKIIAKAQITNGGPIILVQPEVSCLRNLFKKG